MTTISEHITAVIDGKSVGDVPADIRERVERGVRVRLDRHAGHSTIHNSNGTVTVTNDRLRVTLPESEFDSREQVFTTAMRVLGHRSEMRIPETVPTDAEIMECAMEQLVYEYLAENCRYNLSETIMRMNGGHRMSEGMSADVAAATVQARAELRDNPKPHLDDARHYLLTKIANDRDYHGKIASWCKVWTIEIIGPMPDQIGTCEYREEV